MGFGEPLVNSSKEMKRLMRRRFVPSHYHRDVHNKVQRLTQGNKSVDEYYKEMEVSLIRTNLNEDREATMTQFLHRLNSDIRDVVKLQHYVEISSESFSDSTPPSDEEKYAEEKGVEGASFIVQRLLGSQAKDLDES